MSNGISILAALPFLLHVLPPISLLTFLHFTIIIIYILSCKHSKRFHVLSISDSRLLLFPQMFFSLFSWASLVAQLVKNQPAMWETWVQSLGWEDPLEKGMATHSSILAWRIPWTEEPGELQSMGSQKSWTQLSMHTVCDTTCFL